MSRKVCTSPDDYIGAVKLNSEWRFFCEYLAMWILDYAAYSPYNPTDPNQWRFGLLQVDETNAEQFCQAMKDRELTADQIRMFTTQPRYPELTFVVNFDEQIFVNGWHDMIAIHDYTPEDWTAIEDDPYDYVPPEVKALWGGSDDIQDGTDE